MTIERLVKRYRAEPSARVRRRMAGLWVKRSGGSPGAFDEALAFLSDADPSVRSVVAGHILKRERSWVGDERPPTTTPIKTMAEGPAVFEKSFLSELREKRRAELAGLEREAVASGRERFDPDVFRTLGDFGDGTDDHYRWGYYLEPEYTRMEQYAAFLNEIAPWKDTR